MIYLKFIPVILYLVEASVASLDDSNDYVDVDEYSYANYYEDYGDDYNLQYDNFYNDTRKNSLNYSLVRTRLKFNYLHTSAFIWSIIY